MSTTSKKKFANASEEKIFPHKHCGRCEKMVPEFSDGYCSNKCRGIDTVKSTHQKKRLRGWIGIGAALAIVVVILLTLR